MCHVRETTRPAAWITRPVRAIAAVALLALAAAPSPAAPAGNHTLRVAGFLEDEVKSDFSLIRIRKQGDLRTMVFVRDNGDEVAESIINVKKPHELLVPYARHMFASYLLEPKPQRVLIVGLGGGAMVHFLKHYDPEVYVDAVEIDPAVVKLADRYFNCHPTERIKIITEDGKRFLETTENRYDVIYLDAFLKPTADTDATGLPLPLKTVQFYKAIQQKVKPDGMVAFNLNPHKELENDIRHIREAFPQVYVFRSPETNVVVLASLAAARAKPPELRARAKEADHRFKATFLFQDVLTHLAPR